MDERRRVVLDRIKNNIAHSGFHLYIVGGAAHPRYAYTIGLRERFGSELVLGGAAYYTVDDVKVDSTFFMRPCWQGTLLFLKLRLASVGPFLSHLLRELGRPGC